MSAARPQSSSSPSSRESRKLGPRSEALAFQIWAYCEPLGWNCTVKEIADGTDAPSSWVGRVVSAKGWSDRLRAPEYEAAQDSYRAFIGLVSQ